MTDNICEYCGRPGAELCVCEELKFNEHTGGQEIIPSELYLCPECQRAEEQEFTEGDDA